MAYSKYLDGYLSILPESERRGVLSRIKEESAQVFADITYDEYKELVTQIADDRSLATVVDNQTDLIDSTKHNKFFGSVYTDLSVMFNEVELVRRAIDSYEKLADSELAELEAEIDLLRANIAETENAVDEKDTVISFSSAFDYSDYNEIPTKANTYLFQDRDGSLLNTVKIKNNKIILPEKYADYSANQKYSYRASLSQDYATGYDVKGKEISKIIDSDENSSWIHLVDSDQKISSNIKYDTGEKVTILNMATCEIKIDFGSTISLNYIDLLFDGSYAPQIIYIKYDTNKYIYTNKIFELYAQNPILYQNKIDTPQNFAYNLHFPDVSASKLYILLGQPNYAYTVDDSDGTGGKQGPGGTAPSDSSKKEYITYTVKPGDCLYHIGKKFGVTWQSIAKLNKVPGPKYIIYAGQVLKIREKQNYITHIAKKGDTLSKLGDKYNVDWRSIAKLNGLSSPYTIYIGREYLIKKK